MPDGVAIIEIWHYECIVQTHFTFLIKVFWEPGNSMQLSCGLSAYIFNLTRDIQVNVDEDAQDFYICFDWSFDVENPETSG